MPNVNEDVIKSLDAIDEKLDNLQADKEVSTKAINDELKRLGAEQLKLAKALADAEQQSATANTDGEKVQSLGHSFVTSKAFEGFASNRKAMYEFKAAETSASTSAGAGVSSYRKPGMVTMPDLPLVIENLFPHVPVTSNSVTYIKEPTFTNNAKIVAERGDKPFSLFGDVEEKSAPIVTIAHLARITTQLSADAPALAAYINVKMQYGLQAKVDAQLVTGAGTATELGGLLLADNHQDPVTLNKITAAKFTSGDTVLDFVLEVKNELEGRAIAPEVLILNPSDWTAIARLKDKQGRYILGGPQSIATKSLWGVPVVTSASMTAGKYVMGNITLGATLYDRQALNLAMSESDEVNFQRNLISIRIERRLGVAYELPQAISGGDFVIPTAG